MHNKNVKQSRIHRLFGIKVKSKLAAAYMDTAVKVLICVVCGALFLTGIYGVIQKVVLPKTESSVTSMFAYEAADNGNGGSGGSGGVETPGVNTEYEMLDGADQEYNIGASYTPLTFRSAAPIDTFQEVKVDGETVDGSNYTVTEGSTIVTFNADYSRALASGDHTVEIVSDGGSTPVTNFEIKNIIPERAVYKRFTNIHYDEDSYTMMYDVITFNPGDEFPGLEVGDVFEYGDYQYCYGYNWCSSCSRWSNICNCGGSEAPNVWTAKVLDMSKESYEEAFSYINSIPMTSMHETFFFCENLKTLPKIPNTVTDLSGAFLGCSSITEVNNLPSSLVNLGSTFYMCSNLKTVSAIIPDSVTDMNHAFAMCSNLENINNISNNVETLFNTFMDCSSLKTVPDISGCHKLINIEGTFMGCTNLTGTITINSTPNFYTNALNGTQITEILGDCGNKEAILATK